MATEHQAVIEHGTDVMNTEFKKLMIKNKELQKENGKLKESITRATDLLLKQDEVQDKIYNENEELKKENEEHLECRETMTLTYNRIIKKRNKEIKELKKENQELKKPLTNKDTRCSPFNVKVNVNYILELMEYKREEIYFDDYELWEGFDEQVKENLMIELAQCINGYINEYCAGLPTHQTWDDYLCEAFCSDLDELLQNGYYSEHIKYEEDEKGDWKYTPIKDDE